MDHDASSSSGDQASLRSALKPVINTYQPESRGAKPPTSRTISEGPDDQVADLFGRCFLRICFWLDVFTSFARKAESDNDRVQRCRAVSLQPAIPPLAKIDTAAETANDGLAPA
jgi:hypothetical protein